MSTPATITIKGEDARFHILRQWDGYPEGESGVIAELQRVIDGPNVWELPRFEADEFTAGIIATLKSGPGNYRIVKNSNQYYANFRYTITAKDGGIQVTWYSNSGTRRGKVLLKRTVK
jgi:hypothetical protein